ncbi:MAG: hypothetical protein IT369_01960 [Candidatus Latescibacteria bacterium]|nr:hypothetical protein [Candidatus Latescibacterota bacterium]
MRGVWILAGALLLLPLVVAAAEPMDAQTLRAGLQRLQSQGWWGELELLSGQTREVQVASLAGDTVLVCEVLGPLMEHRAVYTLAQIRSLRELGAQRIPLRRAAYTPPRSTPVALGMELVVPGAGYYYAGQTRQGLVLLGLAGAVVATGLATGKGGQAGWVPLALWVKVASLVNLHAELGGINAVAAEGRQPSPTPGVQLRLSY